jgi:AraC-like DNA-binding protein
MSVKTTIYKQFDSLEVKESKFSVFNLPEHFHETYCIGLLSNGIKECTIENSETIVHSNSISILNPYQVHSDKNIDTSECNYKMIYVNKDVVDYFGNKLTGKKEILFTNDLLTDPTIVKKVEIFFDENQNDSSLNQNLSNLIESLILNGNHIQLQDNKNLDSKNALEDCIEKARLNFAEKIDIEKMAKECKLSKFQFIRYFKKKTGITPASYILIQRINFAKNLLLNNVPIGQAALEAGFYDHAQFCKFFKYYTNTSPSDYKQSCNIVQA